MNQIAKNEVQTVTVGDGDQTTAITGLYVLTYRRYDGSSWSTRPLKGESVVMNFNFFVGAIASLDPWAADDTSPHCCAPLFAIAALDAASSQADITDSAGVLQRALLGLPEQVPPPGRRCRRLAAGAGAGAGAPAVLQPPAVLLGAG